MKRLVLLLFCCFFPVACVGSKEFTVRTSPEGADIALNGKFVGKSPVTLMVEQDKTLGFVAHKDGYALGSATIPTQSHWFYSLLWTKNDPKAQFIEQDEVTIPLRKLSEAADYVPAPLPAYEHSSVFGRAKEEAPALRPMPEQ